MLIDDLVSAADLATATANPGSLCEIPRGWQPTPENINALPEPLRHYIMLLQTRTDPAGETQEVCSLRDQVTALVRRVHELQGELRRSSGLNSP